MKSFQWRQCQRPSCQFRFPVTDARQTGEFCPVCGQRTQISASSLPFPNAKDDKRIIRGTAVAALLDNLRSVYNVGSIFRTADAAGVSHLYLAGITSPPTHTKIAKTALGAEKQVPWSHHPNGMRTAVHLQKEGWQIWTLEEGDKAVPLFNLPAPSSPTLLVVGNELAGVDPGIQSVSDQIVSLPMAGSKRSLNVATAFGIAIYFLGFQFRSRRISLE